MIVCLSESTAKLMFEVPHGCPVFRWSISTFVSGSLSGTKTAAGSMIPASPPRNIGNISNPNTTCRYPSLSPLCSKASKIMEQNPAMARCNKEGKNMQKWRLGKSFLDIPVPLGDFVWFLSDSIFGYALYYVCRQDVNFMCAFGIFPCKHIECMWRKLVGENQTSLLSLFGDDVWAWNH